MITFYVIIGVKTSLLQAIYGIDPDIKQLRQE